MNLFDFYPKSLGQGGPAIIVQTDCETGLRHLVSAMSGIRLSGDFADPDGRLFQLAANASETHADGALDAAEVVGYHFGRYGHLGRAIDASQPHYHKRVGAYLGFRDMWNRLGEAAKAVDNNTAT